MQNKKKVILIFFLVITFFSVRSINAGKSVLNYGDIVQGYTEIIFSYIRCGQGICENKLPSELGGGDSKELFVFYGQDADCDNFEEKCNSYDCSLLSVPECIQDKEKCKGYNSGKECINCSGLSEYDCSEIRQKCVHDKVSYCKKTYPYGRSGTVKTYGKVSTNGVRTYLDGYNSFGLHWFKTGFNNPGGKAMGVKANTRNVYFNNNIYQSGDNLNITLNANNNVANKIIWKNDKHMSESKEYIETGNGKINFHSENENIMEVNGSAGYNTKVHNGLEVNDKIKTDAITWLGDTGVYHNLSWTPIIGMENGYPNPSKEDKQILFYYTP